MWCVVVLALVFGFCAVIAALWLAAAADFRLERERERARIMRADTVTFCDTPTVEMVNERRT